VLSAEGSEVRAEAVVSNRVNAGGVLVPKVSDEQGLLALAGKSGAVQVKKA